MLCQLKVILSLVLSHSVPLLFEFCFLKSSFQKLNYEGVEEKSNVEFLHTSISRSFNKENEMCLLSKPGENP